MKKIYAVIILLVLSLIVACGQGNGNDNGNVNNNSDVETNDGAQNNNTGTQNNNDNITDNGMADNTDQADDHSTNSGDQISKMESLEYIDFDLSVEYKGEQDYDADLELENNRVEASLEDDLNGIDIKGNEAFDEIYPLVEQLTIDQNTSKEDVIAQVLEVLDLPTDYNEFELEITFKDGTKKEYNNHQ